MSEGTAASMTNLPDKSEEGEMRPCIRILNEPSLRRNVIGATQIKEWREEGDRHGVDGV